MTALEARAPTVRCGYFDLNHAESAPGYDPPIVIHEFAGEILYNLFLLSSSMKNAISFKACLELRYFKFSFVKDWDLKGKDYP
jgi:hypothetical protein